MTISPLDIQTYDFILNDRVIERTFRCFDKISL